MTVVELPFFFLVALTAVFAFVPSRRLGGWLVLSGQLATMAFPKIWVPVVFELGELLVGHGDHDALVEVACVMEILWWLGLTGAALLAAFAPSKPPSWPGPRTLEFPSTGLLLKAERVVAALRPKSRRVRIALEVALLALLLFAGLHHVAAEMDADAFDAFQEVAGLILWLLSVAFSRL